MDQLRNKTKTASWRFVLRTGVALACLTIFAESAARIRQYMRFGTLEPINTFEVDPGSGLWIPIPGWVTSTIRVDSRGFRSPEIEDPKPPKRIRLCFLGASTTFCAEASSNEATWPHLVTESLRANHPAVSFDYLNASVLGYRLEHMLETLEGRVKRFDPDVIIVYEATNDLAYNSRISAIRQGVYAGHDDPEDWLTRKSLAWYLIRKNLVASRRLREAEGVKPRLRYSEVDLVDPYRTRLGQLLRRCREVAPVVAVATFSQRLRRGQSPEVRSMACTTHSYYMPYMDAEALIRAFDDYNSVIRESAGGNRCILIDGEERIPADALHFADSTHFTDLGCSWMAGRVTKALEAAGEFRELLASRR